MHGVFIESGPTDWQIVQQENCYGTISLKGTYQVPQAAIEVGTESAYPIIRILSEEDNSQIIPWTRTSFNPDQNGMSGSWDMNLTIPAGGLYRIETGLDTKSSKPDLGWIFRGDVRLHIGIGDIFVIAGQSNSSGYGRDSALDSPDINVHLFRNRGIWDLACHPINESTSAADLVNVEMGISGTSPYLSFGKDFYKLSRFPVGLIVSSLGGSPISRWDIQRKGDLYHNMIDKIKACGNKVAGILWYQGCSDTSPDLSSQYYDSFVRLVMQTRKDLGYEIPYFTFQLNRELNAKFNEDWGILREAQRQAAIQIPKVYILPTLHCSLCDGIHNNSHSNLMLGSNLAKLCAGVLYDQPKFLAPDIKEAQIKDNVLRLTFANMRKGFLQINNNIQHSGLLIKDSEGDIPYSSYTVDKANPDTILITLSRVVKTPATVSYAWESDPSHIPFFDEVTFMPALSFYEFPIRI